MVDFARLPATAQIAAGVAGLYIVYILINTTSTWLRRRSLKRQMGVKKATRIPTWDSIMGLDFFVKNIKALKAHNLLEIGTERFATLKTKTTRVRVLGQLVHATIEPENLKTIQAIDFKKWGLGTRRKVRPCKPS
jgi:hypothetical protein